VHFPSVDRGRAGPRNIIGIVTEFSNNATYSARVCTLPGIAGIYLILLQFLESPGIVLVVQYTLEKTLENGIHPKHILNSGFSSRELGSNK